MHVYQFFNIKIFLRQALAFSQTNKFYQFIEFDVIRSSNDMIKLIGRVSHYLDDIGLRRMQVLYVLLVYDVADI